jgi:hypothetical protein
VIVSVPPWEISLANSIACSNAELTKVVTLEAPFTRTVDPVTKLAPVTFNVSAALPAGTTGGLTPPAVGGGFSIMKVTAGDMPAAVLTTTGLVPGTVMALAGMVATRVMPLPEELKPVTGTCAEPKVTMEFEAKPTPVINNGNAGPPAVALPGAIWDITGGGRFKGVMFRGRVPEVPPPSPFIAGVVTPIEIVPGIAISAAVIVTCNSSKVTKVVVCAVPLTVATDIG